MSVAAAHGSSGFFRNSFFFAKNSPVLRKICNFAPRKWLNNNTRFSQVVSGMVYGGFSCEIFWEYIDLIIIMLDSANIAKVHHLPLEKHPFCEKSNCNSGKNQTPQHSIRIQRYSADSKTVIATCYFLKRCRSRSFGAVWQRVKLGVYQFPPLL